LGPPVLRRLRSSIPAFRLRELMLAHLPGLQDHTGGALALPCAAVRHYAHGAEQPRPVLCPCLLPAAQACRCRQVRIGAFRPGSLHRCGGCASHGAPDCLPAEGPAVAQPCLPKQVGLVGSPWVLPCGPDLPGQRDCLGHWLCALLWALAAWPGLLRWHGVLGRVGGRALGDAVGEQRGRAPSEAQWRGRCAFPGPHSLLG